MLDLCNALTAKDKCSSSNPIKFGNMTDKQQRPDQFDFDFHNLGWSEEASAKHFKNHIDDDWTYSQEYRFEGIGHHCHVCTKKADDLISIFEIGALA